MGSAATPDVVTDGLLVRAFSELHYDALNAGVGELLAGPTALREIGRMTPALLSANGAFASPEAPSGVIKPYVIRDVGGRRVALVGVTDGGATGYGSVKPTSLPADALRAILPEVRSKADLVVVLADVDLPSVSPLAEDGLGIDVLLGARSSVKRDPTLIGNTVVANAGGLGRYVDKLTLTFGPDGRITSFSQDETLLNDSIPDDPGIVQLQATYKG